MGSSLREFPVDAVIFPRAGTLSAHPACPGLRLRLVFGRNSISPAFDAFEQADLDRTQPVGIRGIAVVSISRRLNPDLLLVNVHHFRDGVRLGPSETQELLRQMDQ